MPLRPDHAEELEQHRQSPARLPDVPPWLAPIQKRYLAAAFAFTLIGGSAMGAVALLLANGYFRPQPLRHLQAHAHAQLFGFLGLFLAGFAYHLIPRMIRRPLPRPRLAHLTFWMFVLGAGLHYVGQPVGRFGWGRWVLGLSAPAMAAGGWLFASTMLRLLHRYRSPQRFERWLRAGAVIFGAGACLDAVTALGAPFHPELEGVYPVASAQAIWELALFGAGVIFVLGVASRLGPALLGTSQMKPALATSSFWLLVVGVPLHAAALLLEPRIAEPLTRALTGLGLLVFIAGFRFRGLGLHAREEDPMFRAGVYFAFASLGLAALSRVVSGLYDALGGGTDVFQRDAERHLITLGFLIGLIMAMAVKLLPGMLGIPLRARRLRWVAVGLLWTSVVLRVTEALAPWLGAAALRTSAVSGVLSWLGLAVFAAMLAVTFRGKRLAEKAAAR